MNYKDCRRLLEDELGIHAPERAGNRNKALRRQGRIIPGAYLNASNRGRGVAYLTFRIVRSSNFICNHTADMSLFEDVPPREIREVDKLCINIRPKDGKWSEALRQLFGD